MFHCSTIVLRELDFRSPKSLLDAVTAKCVGVLVNVIQPKLGKADTMTLLNLLKEEFSALPAPRRTGHFGTHLGYQNIPNITSYWYLGDEVML